MLEFTISFHWRLAPLCLRAEPGLSLTPPQGSISARSSGPAHEAWGQIPTLSLASPVTLGEALSFLFFSFLILKKREKKWVSQKNAHCSFQQQLSEVTSPLPPTWGVDLPTQTPETQVEGEDWMRRSKREYAFSKMSSVECSSRGKVVYRSWG